MGCTYEIDFVHSPRVSHLLTSQIMLSWNPTPPDNKTYKNKNHAQWRRVNLHILKLIMQVYLQYNAFSLKATEDGDMSEPWSMLTSYLANVTGRCLPHFTKILFVIAI